MPGTRVAATCPTWSSGGPTGRKKLERPPSWQLAQPSSRYACRPRAIGSVAAGSGAQATTRRTTARLQRRRSRPIMRRVPENASLNDVTVVLDDRMILRGISLEVAPGLTLLRGPNGAGKTTLLRALAGLAPL